jgi:hypothetical protein
MKYFISHRGNINGRVPQNENHPDYIDEAIHAGYDVEIDLWYVNDKLWLGHDEAQYETSLSWLANRGDKLWIHCKNHEAMSYFVQYHLLNMNWFWHQEDDMVLTSKRHIWAYPGKQPIKNSIAVMPEIHSDDVSLCIGICSDVIEKYKNEY